MGGLPPTQPHRLRSKASARSRVPLRNVVERHLCYAPQPPHTRGASSVHYRLTNWLLPPVHGSLNRLLHNVPPRSIPGQGCLAGGLPSVPPHRLSSPAPPRSPIPPRNLKQRHLCQALRSAHLGHASAVRALPCTNHGHTSTGSRRLPTWIPNLTLTGGRPPG